MLTVCVHKRKIMIYNCLLIVFFLLVLLKLYYKGTIIKKKICTCKIRFESDYMLSQFIHNIIFCLYFLLLIRLFQYQMAYNRNNLSFENIDFFLKVFKPKNSREKLKKNNQIYTTHESHRFVQFIEQTLISKGLLNYVCNKVSSLKSSSSQNTSTFSIGIYLSFSQVQSRLKIYYNSDVPQIEIWNQ